MFSFGYRDVHYAPFPLSNVAVKPYRQHHTIDANGDGMFLAWAIDANGDPATINAVHYVRVYNPVLAGGSATGEVSPKVITSFTGSARKRIRRTKRWTVSTIY